MDWNRIGPPSDVRPLFPVERAQLLHLLAALPREQWERETACPGWTVHHLVGHIVQGYLRKLSVMRDGHSSGVCPPGEDLPVFLARVNGEFASAATALSPAVLIDLLGHFGPQLDDFWSGLDVSVTGTTDVGWIAPGIDAPIWVDAARELSELWVHQQQLRDAVGMPGARDPGLVYAVLDTLVRGLPRTLADVTAEPGAIVTVEVTGDVTATWTAARDQMGWRLNRGSERPAGLAHVTMSADTLWRAATRGMEPWQTAQSVQVTGDGEVGRAALRLLSIVR